MPARSLLSISAVTVAAGFSQHLDMAGEAEVDVAQCRGGDVFFVQPGFIHADQRQVAHRPIAQARDRQREALVANHGFWRYAHAPGAQQVVQLRRAAAHGRHAGHRRRGGVRLGIRVDENQRAPAAEHELVDGVASYRRQVLRMHNHQHVDVGVDALQLGREALHRRTAAASVRR